MNAPNTLLNQSFAIAADHGGFGLKQHLLDYLKSKNISNFIDLGTDSDKSVHFPDYAGKMVETIKSGKAQWGILICGTGLGMSIAANRHAGIYAALCHDTTTARLARQHNNANILAMGGRILGPTVAEDIVETFLHTAFLGDRYQDRIGMIDPGC
ncbi:MAG TPA: ribose 5-phosphate isomerase B [Alphaproteobacteria bacterium]